MTNNQIPLPEGEDEILTQAEAYRMMGVSRAVLRGLLERGDLKPADHNGPRGAARVRRSDVAALMESRGLKPMVVVPSQPGQGACRGCEVLREQVRRLRDDLARMERALNAALRSA